MSKSQDHQDNAYAFSITKAEIQEIVAHIIDRELNTIEMQLFVNRFEKHLGWEYVHQAIQECLREIIH